MSASKQTSSMSLMRCQGGRPLMRMPIQTQHLLCQGPAVFLKWPQESFPVREQLEWVHYWYGIAPRRLESSSARVPRKHQLVALLLSHHLPAKPNCHSLRSRRISDDLQFDMSRNHETNAVHLIWEWNFRYRPLKSWSMRWTFDNVIEMLCPAQMDESS